MGLCVQASIGETRLPRGFTHVVEMNPLPSASLFISFPLSSPSLPSSLFQTLVLISTNVGTPGFRSANKLAAFPSVQCPGSAVYFLVSPAGPTKRKEGNGTLEHPRAHPIPRTPLKWVVGYCKRVTPDLKLWLTLFGRPPPPAPNNSDPRKQPHTLPVFI